MNRVIMEVLPTDWSPRKTSLYFARGASCPPELGVAPALFGAVADEDAGWAGRVAEDDGVASLIF